MYTRNKHLHTHTYTLTASSILTILRIALWVLTRLDPLVYVIGYDFVYV